MNILDGVPVVAAVASLTLAATTGTSAFLQSRLTSQVSDFFSVQSVRVGDVQQGGVPEMEVRRTIGRDFLGRWQVTIRQVTSDGMESVCEAESPWRTYTAGAKLPADLNLEWWTEGKCAPPIHTYEPGQYFVATTWTVKIAGADVPVANISNVFEVTE